MKSNVVPMEKPMAADLEGAAAMLREMATRPAAMDFNFTEVMAFRRAKTLLDALLRSEGPDVRPPDIGTAIGPDVFIGRKKRQVIGRIEHCGAVITYPKISGEKASARSGDGCGEITIRVQGSNPLDRNSVVDDSIQVKPKLPD